MQRGEDDAIFGPLVSLQSSQENPKPFYVLLRVVMIRSSIREIAWMMIDGQGKVLHRKEARFLREARMIGCCLNLFFRILRIFRREGYTMYWVSRGLAFREFQKRVLSVLETKKQYTLLCQYQEVLRAPRCILLSPDHFHSAEEHKVLIKCLSFTPIHTAHYLIICFVILKQLLICFPGFHVCALQDNTLDEEEDEDVVCGQCVQNEYQHRSCTNQIWAKKNWAFKTLSSSVNWEKRRSELVLIKPYLF